MYDLFNFEVAYDISETQQYVTKLRDNFTWKIVIWALLWLS